MPQPIPRLYLLAPTLGGVVAGLLYQAAFAVSLKLVVRQKLFTVVKFLCFKCRLLPGPYIYIYKCPL